MADKKKSHGSGPGFLEKHFGLAITLFILVIFSIWVLTGGSNTKNVKGKSNFLSSPVPSSDKY
jgi:hypothetical protein